MDTSDPWQLTRREGCWLGLLLGGQEGCLRCILEKEAGLLVELVMAGEREKDVKDHSHGTEATNWIGTYYCLREVCRMTRCVYMRSGVQSKIPQAVDSRTHFGH